MNHAPTAWQLKQNWRHRLQQLEQPAPVQRERRLRGELLKKSAGLRRGNAQRKQGASV
jgi:hypothetical protein